VITRLTGKLKIYVTSDKVYTHKMHVIDSKKSNLWSQINLIWINFRLLQFTLLSFQMVWFLTQKTETRLPVNKKLSCGWHAARTLVRVVFPTLRPAGRYLLVVFSDIFLPFFHLTPSMRKVSSSYRVHIWYGKTRMAGLQSGEARTLHGDRLRVVWTHNTSAWQTDRQTDAQTATSLQQ